MPTKLMPYSIGWLLILIAGISLILRIGYGLTLENEYPFRADAGKYLTLALNLVNHGIYSLGGSPPLETSTLITPGYPLLLSLILRLTGDLNLTYQAVLVIQAVFGTATAMLSYAIARQCHLPRAAAILAFVLVSFYPHQITSGGLILTESLFTFLMTLATFLLIKGVQEEHSKAWLFAGIILGVAALTRPIALPIGVGIWLTFCFVQPRLEIAKRAIPVAILPLLMYSPWMIFTSIHENPEQVSNAKSVFALGTYPNFTYKTDRYYGFPHREDPNYPKMQESLSFSLSELRHRASLEPIKYLYWYTIGKPLSLWQWDIIQGAGGANIYPIKHSLYNSSALYGHSQTLLKTLHPILVTLAFLTAVVVLLRSFFRHLARRETGLLILAAIFAYIVLAHTIMASLPRFSIPFQPTMIVLALSLLSLWSERFGHKK